MLNQKSETKQKAVTVKRRDGELIYVVGSSGSGKTTWIKQRVRASRRVLVWDGKHIDWGPRDRFTVVESFADLRTRLRGAARVSVRVPITRENFDFFCRFALVWGQLEPGDLIVDEIADVTSAGKAPVAWGQIVRKIRAFGTNTIVSTQRPQECDKTAQGNAMVFHVGRMSDEEDQRYVARRLLGSIKHYPLVAALRPLQWIERDVRTLRITTGTLRHSRK